MTGLTGIQAPPYGQMPASSSATGFSGTFQLGVFRLELMLRVGAGHPSWQNGHAKLECTEMSDDAELHAGPGTFSYRDIAARASGQIRVFYHVPERVNPASRILIALHGLDREASDFRDVFVETSEHIGKIVIVPEFDLENFPDLYSYNFGNVIHPPPSLELKHRKVWSFTLVDRLFSALKNANRYQHHDFDIYGNSAGSQYVLRYVALTGAPLIRMAISSNSGIYMLPNLDVAYPSGMGGIGLAESSLRRYLSRPLHILLGDNDVDTAAPDLPGGPEADAQGPHRLARGLWHYKHCKSLARTLGIDLRWTVEVVPGAGHVSQAIFNRALMISG